MESINTEEFATAIATVVGSNERAGINLLATAVLAIVESSEMDRTKFAKSLIANLDLMSAADPNDLVFQSHAKAFRRALLGDYDPTDDQSA